MEILLGTLLVWFYKGYLKLAAEDLVLHGCVSNMSQSWPHPDPQWCSCNWPMNDFLPDSSKETTLRILLVTEEMEIWELVKLWR